MGPIINKPGLEFSKALFHDVNVRKRKSDIPVSISQALRKFLLVLDRIKSIHVGGLFGFL